MLTIRESTKEDIKNIQRLWADGDVMRFVGFPEGLHETEEAMLVWLDRLSAARPRANHYSVYEDGAYCGETNYSIDKETGSASLDIKLFRFARGRGIATRALSHAIENAFQNGAQTVWVDPAPENAKAIALYQRLGFTQKPMPEHVIAIGEDPAENVYFELCRANFEPREENVMKKKDMIEALARDAHEKGGFNGAWLYAEHGEIVSKGALGWRDAENKLPMTEDAIFEMASITKMFTATAVMLLVREGKLGLDDEYVKYFPDYPYPGVTLRHLLTHTSGMPDYDVEDLVAPVLEEEKRIPPCGEIIDLMRKSDEEPVGAPGEKFCYSDVGYMLLANAVEKASGVSFEEFMKKNVFEPVGMKDSGIYHTRRDGRPSDRFARNMVLEDGSEDSFVPSDICEETAPYVVGSDGMNGCDYLYTTIFDMLAWDRALREETVLTKEEQQLMYTTVKLNNGEDYADGDGDGYGFGWAINRDPGLGFIVCHSGGMPGLETWFERFVDADRVLVFMSCRDHTDGRAFYGFSQALEDIARDKEPKPITSLDDIVVKDPDESKWESFCGRYEHPEDSDFIIDEVFMKDGELYANAIDDEGDEMSFRLYPIGENEFGRKGGMLDLTFGDGCLMFDGLTCKKL